MQVAGTDKRLYSANINTGSVINGLVPDGRAMVNRAREESKQYESMFGIKIPGGVLAERLALKFQMNTIYNGYRPHGTSVIISNHD